MVSGLQSKNFEERLVEPGLTTLEERETPGGYATGVQNYYRKGQRAVQSKS
jgi:hypothetical protein